MRVANIIINDTRNVGKRRLQIDKVSQSLESKIGTLANVFMLHEQATNVDHDVSGRGGAFRGRTIGEG